MKFVYVENTNVVELIGLKDAVADAFINNATVTVTLYDSTGVAVTVASGGPAQSWPTTMDYVAASDGIYRAYLSSGLELVAGNQYFAHIDADSGGAQGHWEFAFVAKTRRSS